MFSLTFWKRLNTYIGWIGLLLLFGLTIFVTNIEIKDVDLWLHLASGRFIANNMIVPDHDFLSFTINNNAWVNHEWFFQVVVHYIYEAFGAEGLINLRMVAVSLTFILLLMIGYSDKRIGITLFLLNMVLLNYMMRIMLRPDMFSLLFFILFMYTLAVQIDQKSSLIMLFVIQVLWVNTHGFFIFGPALVLIMIVSEWIKRNVKLPYEWAQVGRYTNEEFRRLGIAFVVVVLACFVNPHHIHGVLYPLKVIMSLGGESQIFFEHIKELGKPIEWNTLFSMNHYPPYRWMIILSSISFILNRKKLDIGMLCLWIIFLLFSLNALRNMIFFAVVSYLVILINFQHIEWKNIFAIELLKKKKLRQAGALVFKIVLIVWMTNMAFGLTTRGYFDFDTMERKSEFGGISLKNYPYKAADFLVANEIKGNFFNDFNSGAYLLGRTHPDIKVFMDGRTEVYGAEYFKNYLKIWRGNHALLAEATNQYNITGAFLNSIQKPAPAKFIRNLYEDPQWRLIYFNFDAAVFLRDIPQNQEWIQAHEVNLLEYQTPTVELLNIMTKQVTPYEHTKRAMALFNMGLIEQAKMESEEAYRIGPQDPTASKILGKIAVLKRDYADAFQYLRKSLLLKSNDNEARYYLGVSLFHLDQLKDAELQCQKLLSMNPRNTKGLALAALIYAKEGKLDAARELWPKEDGDLFSIEEIVNEINPNKELLSQVYLPL